MRSEIHFLKVSGAGNDFLLIDNLNGFWSLDWSRFAVAACSRPFGVGADGILVLEKSEHADFLMRYINADGSFGGMCGNGGRCVSRYASEKGIAGTSVQFEACERLYQATVRGEVVELHMPDITGFPLHKQFAIGAGESLNGWVVNTGSPHVVIPSDAIQEIDVTRIGRAIRNHPRVNPEGANINFYEKRGAGLLDLRTYERGVEAETFACGTGAVATAVVSSIVDGTTSPVYLRVRSGEQLTVGFRMTGTGFTDMILEGSAHFLFTGTVVYDPTTGVLSDQIVHVAEPGR